MLIFTFSGAVPAGCTDTLETAPAKAGIAIKTLARAMKTRYLMILPVPLRDRSSACAGTCLIFVGWKIRLSPVKILGMFCYINCCLFITVKRERRKEPPDGIFPFSHECGGVISLQTNSPLYSQRLYPLMPMSSSIPRYFYSHARMEVGVSRKNTGCSIRNGTEGTPAPRTRNSSHGPGFFSSRNISKRMKRLLREFPRICMLPLLG